MSLGQSFRNEFWKEFCKLYKDRRNEKEEENFYPIDRIRQLQISEGSGLSGFEQEILIRKELEQFQKEQLIDFLPDNLHFRLTQKGKDYCKEINSNGI